METSRGLDVRAGGTQNPDTHCDAADSTTDLASRPSTSTIQGSNVTTTGSTSLVDQIITLAATASSDPTMCRKALATLVVDEANKHRMAEMSKYSSAMSTAVCKDIRVELAKCTTSYEDASKAYSTAIPHLVKLESLMSEMPTEVGTAMDTSIAESVIDFHHQVHSEVNMDPQDGFLKRKLNPSY